MLPIESAIFFYFFILFYYYFFFFIYLFYFIYLFFFICFCTSKGSSSEYLTHLSRVDSSTITLLTDPFPNEGMSD